MYFVRIVLPHVTSALAESKRLVLSQPTPSPPGSTRLYCTYVPSVPEYGSTYVYITT